jgi:Family of unknown function (DUF6491)
MKLSRIGTSLATALAVAVPGAGAVQAESAKSAQPQASIPFVQYGGIRDWRADKTRGLWIQDSHRQWYYAKLMGPCFGLDFAQTIAFDTRPMGTFDRSSAIIVPHEGRCQVQSIVQSEPPPRKQRNVDSSDGQKT